MRDPLCSDSPELCSEDQGLIGSEGERNCKFQLQKPVEKSQYRKASVFGICLDNLMGTSFQASPQIPFILSRLCHYIEEYGLRHKHLFMEFEESMVENLKVKFSECGDAPLETSGNVASAAKLLIIFFEELPEPLIPVSSQHDFISAIENLSLSSVDCVSSLKQNVEKLPNSSYHVLKFLSRFLFRLAAYEDFNGLNYDNIGLIFGPAIFRLSSSDPSTHVCIKNIIRCFVHEYHAIFENRLTSVTHEDKVAPKKGIVMQDHKIRGQLPSSVVPVTSMLPLSVVIPSLDSDENDGNIVKESVPILLIEGQVDSSSSRNDNTLGMKKTSSNKDNVVTRKRKERRLSGEDLQQRSSSEERPPATGLVSSNEIELMRRCNSHDEMKEAVKAADTELDILRLKKGKNETSYLSDSSELVIDETSNSPHPPDAKRRELDANVSIDSKLMHSWKCSTQFPDKNLTNEKVKQVYQYDSKQSPIAEFGIQNIMDCDSSGSFDSVEDEYFSSSNDSEILESEKARIPRSASCPVPKTEVDASESDSSLSLSWSMLFEPEDSEPMRSEQRYSWPMTKDGNDDALLSPSVQGLRKSNYYEAPLSPSAFRSYLSYRSNHLDPSVPPSPPVEQEDFAKNLIESNALSDSIKQLMKKIHCIKKRIKKFDEKFEMEFGYKPSHAQKAINPETKKLMSDLHKARKELKALKEESHLEHVSSTTNWHASRGSHILGDTTNQVIKEPKDKSKVSVEDTFGITMKTLAEDRKIANRPELFEEMTKQQVKDEKLAIQRALLQFESVHGKPSTKGDRKTLRPLYDRYRSVKKLLVRSGSFPGSVNKSKEVCTELQPILEHETMDFISPQHRTGIDIEDCETELKMEEKCEVQIQESTHNDEQKDSCSANYLSLKYDNSNIHELPLSEMIFQLQQVKSEKRHLRKILRDFESEFFKLNGRKVQKDDKAPIETLYGEYKHVKARLKLLEALISKHDQHQLM